ncbi:MAG: acyl-CoA desaturase [Myxococcota bacterium]
MGSEGSAGSGKQINWIGSLPFFGVMAAAVVGLFFFEFSWQAGVLVAASYFVRMFGITGGYHRYFAHRGYKTSRWFQFVLALLGTSASQKGVLWWSGHHRDHHKYSDEENDIHSPKHGFWWSHIGWILAPDYVETPQAQLREFGSYPELRWLNKHWSVPPIALAVILYLTGGLWALYWGFAVATTLLWHGTFTINSLSHVWGTRRYKTSDTSRNNFLLAMLTMGEGWHNNHHHYGSTANNGFFWWEIDITYVILLGLEKLGVVWDLRRPPAWVLEGRARKLGAVGEALETHKGEAEEEPAAKAA